MDPAPARSTQGHRQQIRGQRQNPGWVDHLKRFDQAVYQPSKLDSPASQMTNPVGRKLCIKSDRGVRKLLATHHMLWLVRPPTPTCGPGLAARRDRVKPVARATDPPAPDRLGSPDHSPPRWPPTGPPTCPAAHLNRPGQAEQATRYESTATDSGSAWSCGGDVLTLPTFLPSALQLTQHPAPS